jgi:membrane associated rhomboid family serine protease
MSSGADLFVVCKNCGSEVSPYITECPYCGTRLRKRAPKLDRDGNVKEVKPRGRAPRATLPKLRRGEIPGIRVDARPYATIALVLASLAVSLAWRGGAFSQADAAIVGPLDGDWWRLLTYSFVYDNAGYQLAALVAVGLFGWLIERRRGPLPVLLIYVAGAAGGGAIEAYGAAIPVAAGANGAALALLLAWLVPELLARRRGDDTDADLLGAGAIGAVVALMPLAAPEASWLVAAGGAAIGIFAGVVLDQAAGEPRG